LRLGGCRASALLRVRRWHWEVSEGYARNGTVIGFPVGLPDVQLLMLAPGVSIYTETEEQFRQEVLKLIRLAQALGRKMVVPNPPCDSQWIGIEDTRRYRNEDEQQALDAGELTLWPYYFDGFQVAASPPRRNCWHQRASVPHCVCTRCGFAQPVTCSRPRRGWPPTRRVLLQEAACLAPTQPLFAPSPPRRPSKPPTCATAAAPTASGCAC
jgi:hypothetical protein